MSEYEIDETELRKIEQTIGISAFNSTKGKDHSASAAYGVMKVSKRKVRQLKQDQKVERLAKRRRKV